MAQQENVIVWVKGNSQWVMIPLEQEVVRQEGEIVTEPYYVDGEAEVTVNFVGKFRTLSYTPIVDGNILKVREDGNLTAGKYNIEVNIINPDGSRLRSMWDEVIVVTNDNNSVLQEWDEFKEQPVEARAAVFFFAKGDKGDSAMTSIVDETESTITALTPNVYHKWGEVAELTIESLGEVQEGVLSQFMIEFQSGETPTTISLPEGILWSGGVNIAEEIKPNKTYQISITNNLGVVHEF